MNRGDCIGFVIIGTLGVIEPRLGFAAMVVLAVVNWLVRYLGVWPENGKRT